MILIKGTENVKDVTLNTSQGGKQWANIEFTNGLKLSTFSETAIAEAQGAMAMGVPLGFIGTLKSREWQGKHYPDASIESAWALTVEKIQTATQAKVSEDLPF